MATLEYYIDNYDKFIEYVIFKHNHHHLYLSNNSKVKIQLNPQTKTFSIDPNDFVKVDMFLVDNKIKRMWYGSSDFYLKTFIDENNIEAFDYLNEIDFFCGKIILETPMYILDYACIKACIDIIMVLILYIDWKKYIDFDFGDYFSRMFGTRDEDIVRLVLDNIPINCINRHCCAKVAIENGRLENFKILKEKYPLIDIFEYLDLAIINGHVEILVYMESMGVDLQDFLDNKNSDTIICCAKNGYIEMIEYIFGKCEFCEEQLDELLSNAYKCTPQYVDILIDAGANFVMYGEKLYDYAIIYVNTELAHYLKKNYL